MSDKWSSPRRRGHRYAFAAPFTAPKSCVNRTSRNRVTPRVKQPVVYILASKPYGTLYIGVTSNLAARVEAHRNGSVEGFTKQYGVHTLVYFEVHADMYEAIQR